MGEQQFISPFWLEADPDIIQLRFTLADGSTVDSANVTCQSK